MGSLPRGQGKLEDSLSRQALQRLTQNSSLDAAVADVHLAIEAAVEKLEIKQSIFARLGELAPPHAILTTNSSTLSSSHIAEASGRADQVTNMHFSTGTGHEVR
nr:3-hydroxyacyl-CoA dehydrogenase NAD-binding domain-containing protein [Pseudarthrobacter sp. lyk4-40-TYG-27]